MYKDLSNEDKLAVKNALISLMALPCNNITKDGCQIGLGKCTDGCPKYDPDTRELMVERISWVVGLQLKGLSEDEAIRIGMLKDEVNKEVK